MNPRKMAEVRASSFSGTRFASFLIFALVLIGLDQLTKALVKQSIAYGTSIEITPFFNLCHVVNTGAAFSFLGEAGGWQLYFFVGFALVICAVVLKMLYQHSREFWLPACLSAVLAGAIGNVIDRVFLGHVVDFLDFHLAGHHWPAFNVADIAICVGAVGVIVLEFLRKR